MSWTDTDWDTIQPLSRSIHSKTHIVLGDRALPRYIVTDSIGRILFMTSRLAEIETYIKGFRGIYRPNGQFTNAYPSPTKPVRGLLPTTPG